MSNGTEEIERSAALWGAISPPDLQRVLEDVVSIFGPSVLAATEEFFSAGRQGDIAKAVGLIGNLSEAEAEPMVQSLVCAWPDHVPQVVADWDELTRTGVVSHLLMHAIRHGAGLNESLHLQSQGHC